MRLTEKDKEMFESLKNTGQGKWLAGFCERLMADMCDCRNWETGTDINAVKLSAKGIENNIIGNLKNINKKSGLPDFE